MKKKKHLHLPYTNTSDCIFKMHPRSPCRASKNNAQTNQTDIADSEREKRTDKVQMNRNGARHEMKRMKKKRQRKINKRRDEGRITVGKMQCNAPIIIITIRINNSTEQNMHVYLMD